MVMRRCRNQILPALNIRGGRAHGIVESRSSDELSLRFRRRDRDETRVGRRRRSQVIRARVSHVWLGLLAHEITARRDGHVLRTRGPREGKGAAKHSQRAQRPHHVTVGVRDASQSETLLERIRSGNKHSLLYGVGGGVSNLVSGSRSGGN